MQAGISLRKNTHAGYREVYYMMLICCKYDLNMLGEFAVLLEKLVKSVKALRV